MKNYGIAAIVGLVLLLVTFVSWVGLIFQPGFTGIGLFLVLVELTSLFGSVVSFIVAGILYFTD